MRGIRFKPTSTMALFIKNAFIYGAGGIIVPFIGIKLIDIALHYDASRSIDESILDEQSHRAGGLEPNSSHGEKELEVGL